MGRHRSSCLASETPRLDDTPRTRTSESESFLDALAVQFPDEPRDQLQATVNMCIYYDYLR
jgi:hypothetical protein